MERNVHDHLLLRSIENLGTRADQPVHNFTRVKSNEGAYGAAQKEGGRQGFATGPTSTSYTMFTTDETNEIVNLQSAVVPRIAATSSPQIVYTRGSKRPRSLSRSSAAVSAVANRSSAIGVESTP